MVVSGHFLYALKGLPSPSQKCHTLFSFCNLVGHCSNRVQQPHTLLCPRPKESMLRFWYLHVIDSFLKMFRSEGGISIPVCTEKAGTWPWPAHKRGRSHNNCVRSRFASWWNFVLNMLEQTILMRFTSPFIKSRSDRFIVFYHKSNVR